MNFKNKIKVLMLKIKDKYSEPKIDFVKIKKMSVTERLRFWGNLKNWDFISNIDKMGEDLLDMANELEKLTLNIRKDNIK